MARNLIKYKTSLVLSDVNYKNIAQDYVNDDIGKLRIPFLKTKIRNVTDIFDNNKGSSVTENIFIIKCKNKTGTVIASDNCIEYDAKKANINCHYCRKKIKDNYFGMPLEIINEINDFDEENIKIHCYGYYHDLSCCLADVKNKIVQNVHDDSFDYQSIYVNIYTLHSLFFKDELYPANDWRLLDINGGSLTYNEWKENVYLYNKLPGILILRNKKIYEKVKN